MSDRPERRPRSPIVTALVLMLREIAELEAEERAARRRRLAVVDGTAKRGGRAA